MYGCTSKEQVRDGLYLYCIVCEEIAPGSSVHDGQVERSASNMKKAPTNKQADELRPEYDLSKLTGGVKACAAGAAHAA